MATHFKLNIFFCSIKMSELANLRDAINAHDLCKVVEMTTNKPGLLHSKIEELSILQYAIIRYDQPYNIIKYLTETGVFDISDILSRYRVHQYNVSELMIRSILENYINNQIDNSAKSAHRKI